jgi:hypothetical protein
MDYVPQRDDPELRALARVTNGGLELSNFFGTIIEVQAPGAPLTTVQVAHGMTVTPVYWHALDDTTRHNIYRYLPFDEDYGYFRFGSASTELVPVMLYGEL